MQKVSVSLQRNPTYSSIGRTTTRRSNIHLGRDVVVTWGLKITKVGCIDCKGPQREWIPRASNMLSTNMDVPHSWHNCLRFVNYVWSSHSLCVVQGIHTQSSSPTHHPPRYTWRVYTFKERFQQFLAEIEQAKDTYSSPKTEIAHQMLPRCKNYKSS